MTHPFGDRCVKPRIHAAGRSVCLQLSRRPFVPCGSFRFSSRHFSKVERLSTLVYMVRCQYHGGTTLTDNVPRKHGKMMLLSSSVPGSVMNTPETPQSRPACTPPRCTACRAFAHNAELNFLLSGVLYVCGP